MLSRCCSPISSPSHLLHCDRSCVHYGIHTVVIAENPVGRITSNSTRVAPPFSLKDRGMDRVCPGLSPGSADSRHSSGIFAKPYKVPRSLYPASVYAGMESRVRSVRVNELGLPLQASESTGLDVSRSIE